MENTDQLTHAPPLPPWLEQELPWRRRMFTGGDYPMHFIDEGSGPPVLMQHGNPTWCYLWRKVIGELVSQPVRVIAPDLIGLGLSGKPRNAAIHTPAFHGEQLSKLIRALDLEEITVVGQDWGGPITGLAAALNPERVRAAVFANTSLRVPEKAPRVTPFHRFANIPVLSDLAFRLLNFPLPVMRKVQGDPASLGKAEMRAYRYPLRRFRDRTAPLALARMVPTHLDHPSIPHLTRANRWAREFGGPVELVWGCRDPILGRALGSNRELFPRARVTETEAGHFLQEEVPEALAAAILRVTSAGQGEEEPQ
ncbi:alpha/beta fold hydrolase [Microbulbifer yueqingensis]|uniref:Haloalkane dehalogenase n=1 Tax=Microbulbifer yueqingensis TaxID=658219 RepID=A0A1G8UMR3_9GAMM|nr:alpha/beta fold hydrolase [Microbulbifer yueqingensis]SDJ54924.1 haloalkane dehalogenase [Microbulbifer yueqingensis]